MIKMRIIGCATVGNILHDHSRGSTQKGVKVHQSRCFEMYMACERDSGLIIQILTSS